MKIREIAYPILCIMGLVIFSRILGYPGVNPSDQDKISIICFMVLTSMFLLVMARFYKNRKMQIVGLLLLVLPVQIHTVNNYIIRLSPDKVVINSSATFISAHNKARIIVHWNPFVFSGLLTVLTNDPSDQLRGIIFQVIRGNIIRLLFPLVILMYLLRFNLTKTERKLLNKWNDFGGENQGVALMLLFFIVVFLKII